MRDGSGILYGMKWNKDIAKPDATETLVEAGMLNKTRQDFKTGFGFV
jgi:hypothetical protein